MILGFRHVGIVVSDLGKALEFYCDLLGLPVVKQIFESGPHLDKMLGLVDVRMTTVKLGARGGGMVELLKCHSHESVYFSRRPLFDFGQSHIALTVDDLDAEYKRLTAAGVAFVSEPVLSPDGRAKVAFFEDPEGNHIELVQEITYPRAA